MLDWGAVLMFELAVRLAAGLGAITELNLKRP